jgi:hypothetical protein
MANVIARVGRPTLVLSHNKTLAAQLYAEFRDFFPHNAVHYFVSYYDYYQPEAYIPQRDIYIEKDAAINKEIDRLRLAATSALVSRRDVVVVASVSCIYGIGSREDYEAMLIHLHAGQSFTREQLLEKLINLQYNRNDITFERGVRFGLDLPTPDGGTIEVWRFEDERAPADVWPSPPIRVRQGQLVHTTLHARNNSHTIHHHGIEPTTLPPISAWWPRAATQKDGAGPSTKTGVTTETSGRCVPPAKGLLSTKLSPAWIPRAEPAHLPITVRTLSPIEPRWTGMCGALAIR